MAGEGQDRLLTTVAFIFILFYYNFTIKNTLTRLGCYRSDIADFWPLSFVLDLPLFCAAFIEHESLYQQHE